MDCNATRESLATNQAPDKFFSQWLLRHAVISQPRRLPRDAPNTKYHHLTPFISLPLVAPLYVSSLRPARSPAISCSQFHQKLTFSGTKLIAAPQNLHFSLLTFHIENSSHFDFTCLFRIEGKRRSGSSRSLVYPDMAPPVLSLVLPSETGRVLSIQSHTVQVFPIPFADFWVNFLVCLVAEKMEKLEALLRPRLARQMHEQDYNISLDCTRISYKS